jgi:hypothetical protein
MNKRFPESTWRTIKLMSDAGWKPREIVKRVSGLKVEQIYAKKRQWKCKEEWKSKPVNLKYYTSEYKELRRKCFKRDGYRCRVCKTKGSKYNPLQMDHIIPWSVSVEKRFDVNNVRTLCKKHHKATPTWGFKALRYKGKINNE